MKVFFLLLTWDGVRYLPDLFKSLDEQTSKDFVVKICDNGSQDGTLEYLREYHSQDLVLVNGKNIGFTKGCNALFKFVVDHLEDKEEEVIVVILNQDIILSADFVEKTIDYFENNAEIDAVQPKLLKAFEENINDDLAERTQSDIIDTTGLTLRKDWRFYERGAGELDTGQYDDKVDIFGVNCALGVFRLSALLGATLNGQLFEGRFFSYREDCELAWRLRRAGSVSRFVPEIRAHHYRGMYGSYRANLWERLKNRRVQRPFASAYSLRNEMYILIMHLRWSDLLAYFPHIVFNYGGRLLYAFFFEGMTRRELIRGLRNIPYMIDNRRKIRENTIIDLKTLRDYVGKS